MVFLILIYNFLTQSTLTHTYYILHTYHKCIINQNIVMQTLYGKCLKIKPMQNKDITINLAVEVFLWV